MTCKTSVKLSNPGIEFLKRLKTNRIKAGIDTEPLSYWQLIEIMEKYFKLHNLEYVDLINVEAKK